MRTILSALLALTLTTTPGVALVQDLDIPFEKHVLDNGLTVVIHEDHSDPVVAVYVVYHVGSGREERGRSGFAHLFEHLMFQGSQHVGDDQHFKLVSEAGGTLNGTTNRDRTNYFETMPSHQLELALWLEADRMGFLLPAISAEKLDNQREVVKNERRQNYENRPYAQSRTAIMAALYPAEHPYNWLTIGSHEDLTAASMEDVVNFFQRWYGPNNATLAIGGDVEPEQALALAEKYFGSIPRGPDVAPPARRPVTLQADVRLTMEDKVKLPQISFTWPTVNDGHSEQPALELLASVLSANKAAVLDKALMVEATLATSVSAYQDSGEQAGEFQITVRAAPGVSLERLEAKVRGLLERLAADGIAPAQLERLKARYESGVINRYETVSARTSALAEANVFRGDPAAFVEDLAATMAVTPAQVEQVLDRYVLDMPAVIMSVVPVGRLDMASRGRTEAQIAREDAFDRSRPPQPGTPTAFSAPALWHDTWDNGVDVMGTPYDEVPLVSISLSLPGGHLRESHETLGLSSLTADLMEEGTAALDTVALTETLDGLGASLSVRSSDDEITISLRTLQRHLDAAVALLGDVLLRPRLDAADFERIKAQRLADLETRGDRINTISGNVWNRLMYGEDSLEGWPAAGTVESVSRLTLDDVRAFHAAAAVPDGARLVVVGDLDAARVRELFAPIMATWRGGEPLPLELAPRPLAAGRRVYLVDKPGAPQSEIRVGHPGLSAVDDDYYPFAIMNYALGGSFSSRINMNLREDKGYTYGARSNNSGDRRTGTFTASSGVRTDVTAESLSEVMNELQAIRDGLTEEETAFVKDAMLQALTRQYEAVRSLDGMVDAVSRYGYPDDYLEQRAALLQRITREDLTALANRYVLPDQATVLVVGDAETVADGLEGLGWGEVIRLDIDGNPIAMP